jgi:outer membrane protein assembly factor BamB
MALPQADRPSGAKPLRLWPGVAAALLQWLFWLVLPFVSADAAFIGIIGGVAFGVAVLVWWLFFSRAASVERWGVLLFIIIALLATRRIVHESVAGGLMGLMLFIYAVPAVSLALVGGAVVARRLSTGLRRAAIAGSILIACGVLALLRTDGVLGGGGSDLHWRWTPTSEERLLSSGGDEPLESGRTGGGPGPAVIEVAPDSGAPRPPSHESSTLATRDSARERSESQEEHTPAAPVVSTIMKNGPSWTGFRGPDRDGVVQGVRIETDWSMFPPVQLWRRPVGPGWSSFAVAGGLLYTQEQRGGDEIVASYKMSTGEPVWRHRDLVRFWESNGGAGPRATPMLSEGRVYAFGATGILNALDAATGSVIWSRNVAGETHTGVPDWGFASSPLVVGDLVIVAADATLVAYDRETGHQRWVGPIHHGSYSSPHRTTIDGVEQILLLGGAGVVSLAPADGAVLWEHPWRGVAIVQPALTSDGDVVVNAIAATGGVGTRRLAIAHRADGWQVEERWTSSGLKPYFNDFVVHKGHAYGFDSNILACIDLADGKRKWKGGRYGNGQLVLLRDQDLLLVLSEEGELALVNAAPDQFREVARVPALVSKTWNHPVLVGDVLLVRNGEEMAAYRLRLARR